MTSAKLDYCRSCLMPMLPEFEQSGDTSFLFASLHCQCQRKKLDTDDNAKSLQTMGFSNFKSARERCPRCRKEIVSEAKIGSFTGFLFQEFRCKCAKPVPASGKTKPISKALQGTLATQFFPHAGNKTRLARLERQAANHTQMVLSGVKNVAIQDLHAGESIANSYVLEEQIGLGGMGAVYRARHQMLGRICALKFLLPSAVSATSWEMFKKEAKILNELQHPAICRIFDMGLHKGCLPFYAMEFLDGITLEELLNRKNTLGLGAALEIFIAVGDALAYAHRHKIIHRDVKPANIMLVQGPKGAVDVKLLDFGIAELSESSGSLGNSEIVGSSAYMSPEQFRGQLPTEATDIYSLACSLFETLAGDAPFDGENFEELRQQHQEQQAPTLKEFTGLDFPDVIEAVLEHALRKDPDRRYRYMSEMTVDMRRVLEGKPLQFAEGKTRFPVNLVKHDSNWAPYVEDETESQSWFGRKPAKLAVMVVASLLLALSIGVSWLCFDKKVLEAVNVLFHWGSQVRSDASVQIRPFHLTKPDYDKLNLIEPYDSHYAYYSFPPDGRLRIGKLVVFDNPGGPGHCVNAEGIVKLPRQIKGQAFGLVLASGIVDDLELLRGFQPDEIVGVVFPLDFVGDSSEAVGVTKISSKESFQLLQAIVPFKRIRCLDAHGAFLDQRCLELLGIFPELDELRLFDSTLLQEESLGHQRVFSQLKMLSVPSLEDLTSLLENLAGAGKITDLRLYAFKSSERELVALSRIKSLQRFGCSSSIITGKLVKLLAACGSIDNLDFSGSHLAPEVAPILLSMKNLKTLTISNDLEESWGKVKFQHWRKELLRRGVLLISSGAFAAMDHRVLETLDMDRQLKDQIIRVDQLKDQINQVLP